MDKALKYKIVCWCVAIFLLIFLPQSISTASQVQITSIVSGLGVDKSEKGLEVSAQIIIPEPSTSYSPKTVVASAEGKNLVEAISNIELKVGQTLGLAHCYVIILGDDLFSENVPDELDYLMRSNIMGNNSALVHTSGKAKELLKISSQLSESDVNNLQNIAKFNKENYSSSNTSLIDLFNDYLSPAGCSLVGTIDTEDSSSQSNESSSGGENSGQPEGEGQSETSGATSTNSKAVLKNDGSAIVVKHGKKLLNLTKEQIIKFNWLDPSTQKGIVEIENYSDENLKNATLSIKKISKKIKFIPKIINNAPILDVHINLESRIESIKDEQGKIYTSHKNFYNASLMNAISDKIKIEISEALQIAKQNNFDIWNLYNIFNTHNSQKWKKYLSSLENSDNYMQNLEISVDVKIENKE